MSEEESQGEGEPVVKTTIDIPKLKKGEEFLAVTFKRGARSANPRKIAKTLRFFTIESGNTDNRDYLVSSYDECETLDSLKQKLEEKLAVFEKGLQWFQTLAKDKKKNSNIKKPIENEIDGKKYEFVYGAEKKYSFTVPARKSKSSTTSFSNKKIKKIEEAINDEINRFRKGIQAVESVQEKGEFPTEIIDETKQKTIFKEGKTEEKVDGTIFRLTYGGSLGSISVQNTVRELNLLYEPDNFELKLGEGETGDFIIEAKNFRESFQDATSKKTASEKKASKVSQLDKDAVEYTQDDWVADVIAKHDLKLKLKESEKRKYSKKKFTVIAKNDSGSFCVGYFKSEETANKKNEDQSSEDAEQSPEPFVAINQLSDDEMNKKLDAYVQEVFSLSGAEKYAKITKVVGLARSEIDSTTIQEFILEKFSSLEHPESDSEDEGKETTKKKKKNRNEVEVVTNSLFKDYAKNNKKLRREFTDLLEMYKENFKVASGQTEDDASNDTFEKFYKNRIEKGTNQAKKNQVIEAEFKFLKRLAVYYMKKNEKFIDFAVDAVKSSKFVWDEEKKYNFGQEIFFALDEKKTRFLFFELNRKKGVEETVDTTPSPLKEENNTADFFWKPKLWDENETYKRGQQVYYEVKPKQKQQFFVLYELIAQGEELDTGETDSESGEEGTGETDSESGEEGTGETDSESGEEGSGSESENDSVSTSKGGGSAGVKGLKPETQKAQNGLLWVPVAFEISKLGLTEWFQRKIDGDKVFDLNYVLECFGGFNFDPWRDDVLFGEEQVFKSFLSKVNPENVSSVLPKNRSLRSKAVGKMFDGQTKIPQIDKFQSKFILECGIKAFLHSKETAHRIQQIFVVLENNSKDIEKQIGNWKDHVLLKDAKKTSVYNLFGYQTKNTEKNENSSEIDFAVNLLQESIVILYNVLNETESLENRWHIEENDLFFAETDEQKTLVAKNVLSISPAEFKKYLPENYREEKDYNEGDRAFFENTLYTRLFPSRSNLQKKFAELNEKQEGETTRSLEYKIKALNLKIQEDEKNPGENNLWKKTFSLVGLKFTLPEEIAVSKNQEFVVFYEYEFQGDPNLTYCKAIPLNVRNTNNKFQEKTSEADFVFMPKEQMLTLENFSYALQQQALDYNMPQNFLRLDPNFSDLKSDSEDEDRDYDDAEDGGKKQDWEKVTDQKKASSDQSEEDDSASDDGAEKPSEETLLDLLLGGENDKSSTNDDSTSGGMFENYEPKLKLFLSNDERKKLLNDLEEYNFNLEKWRCLNAPQLEQSVFPKDEALYSNFATETWFRKSNPLKRQIFGENIEIEEKFNFEAKLKTILGKNKDDDDKKKENLDDFLQENKNWEEESSSDDSESESESDSEQPFVSPGSTDETPENIKILQETIKQIKSVIGKTDEEKKIEEIFKNNRVTFKSQDPYLYSLSLNEIEDVFVKILKDKKQGKFTQQNLQNLLLFTNTLQIILLMILSRKMYVYSILGNVNWENSFTKKKKNEIENFKDSLVGKLEQFHDIFKVDNKADDKKLEIERALFYNNDISPKCWKIKGNFVGYNVTHDNVLVVTIEQYKKEDLLGDTIFFAKQKVGQGIEEEDSGSSDPSDESESESDSETPSETESSASGSDSDTESDVDSGLSAKPPKNQKPKTKVGFMKPKTPATVDSSSDSDVSDTSSTTSDDEPIDLPSRENRKKKANLFSRRKPERQADDDVSDISSTTSDDEPIDLPSRKNRKKKANLFSRKEPERQADDVPVPEKSPSPSVSDLEGNNSGDGGGSDGDSNSTIRKDETYYFEKRETGDGNIFQFEVVAKVLIGRSEGFFLSNADLVDDKIPKMNFWDQRYEVDDNGTTKWVFFENELLKNNFKNSCGNVTFNFEMSLMTNSDSDGGPKYLMSPKMEIQPGSLILIDSRIQKSLKTKTKK